MNVELNEEELVLLIGALRFLQDEGPVDDVYPIRALEIKLGSTERPVWEEGT